MFALINEHSKPSTQNNEECLHTSPDFTHLWHQRYGYFGYKGLKLLQTKNMVHGLPHLDIPNITCVECLSGKQNISDIPKKANREKVTFQNSYMLIYVIPWNLSQKVEKGTCYALLMTFNKKGWVHLLSQNSESLECFKLLKTYVEKETNSLIKCLRTDKEESSTPLISSCSVRRRRLEDS